MKKRTFLTAMAAAALLPGLVLAHGPTRQKVTLTTEVAADPAEVWAAIGNFQDVSWHPAVHATTGENGNDIDATRLLTLGQEGGPTIAEVLYKYSDEKMSYSYRITEVEGRGAAGHELLIAPDREAPRGGRLDHRMARGVLSRLSQQ